MNIITLKNVSKVFENKQIAVNKVNLKIDTNEFIVLTGPSGCGKTTLLRLIAGLETPTSGEIIINNKDAKELKPHQRDIAMVFQDHTLYPNLNVFNNIALSLKINHEEKVIIEQKVNNIAKLLDISKLLKRKPHTLSGGQLQRVAIACALVKNTSIILFDEPVSNLDIEARKDILKVINKIKKEIKATYIYVTHDTQEAKVLADHVVYMKDGKIVKSYK